MADETDAPAPSPQPAPTPAPTPLIYLDVDDEITSAAARIRSAEADRLALVLPYGSRLATSRINFRLLAREAAERGKRIEIICADASARALAVAAGLVVHPSVAAFEGRSVPVDAAAGAAAAAAAAAATTPGFASSLASRASGSIRKRRASDAAEDADGTSLVTLPRRSSPKVPIVGPPRPPVRTGVAIGIGVALIALVIVGSLVAADLLPAATITLHPRAEQLGPLALTIEARADVTAPDPAGLAIPAQRITFQLQAAQTFTATGMKLVETKATGTVTFSNFDTGGANRIDAGAIVKTPDGIEFATQAAVTLPNATIQFPFTIVPSTASVGVQAVTAGPNGNVGNNTITVVPKGQNRRLLQVTNEQATTGGASTPTTVISSQDVDAAKAAIDAALNADLDRQVSARTGVPVGLTLFPETRAVGATTYATDPATFVDTEAPTFDLNATAQATVIAVDPTPLGAVAEARLRTKVTSGWAVLAGSIASEVGVPSVAGEVISYPVSVHGTEVHGFDQAALIGQIKGLLLGDARARLADYGDVEISVWPDWVSTIPTHTDRITFAIGEPQASPTPGP
ncbi:MAG TPA: baseplate J/gp47 family protein [Candidatus Dormibacteraeota bacterium]|nr:baseplate J/gp47 family protein [Candidatus Dormibacteraeota bacterium]